MRYLFVTGSREFRGPLPGPLQAAIYESDAVVHGDCPRGLDRSVRDELERLTHHAPESAPQHLRVPAVCGSPVNRSAGFERNEAMAEMARVLRDLGHDVRCVGVLVQGVRCAGTHHCMRMMRDREIETQALVVRPEDLP